MGTQTKTATFSDLNRHCNYVLANQVGYNPLITFRCFGDKVLEPRPTKKKSGLTDYFSKRLEAEAIPTKEAKHVVGFLYKMILCHGCPEEIVSDQGREFCKSAY